MPLEPFCIIKTVVRIRTLQRYNTTCIFIIYTEIVSFFFSAFIILSRQTRERTAITTVCDSDRFRRLPHYYYCVPVVIFGAVVACVCVVFILLLPIIITIRIILLYNVFFRSVPAVWRWHFRQPYTV